MRIAAPRSYAGVPVASGELATRSLATLPDDDAAHLAERALHALRPMG